ncbi:hypothetical protein I4U23_007439 [Adineta vaga]|nr:hypothetical protein I4U23_007439 [Adineta vaga]
MIYYMIVICFLCVVRINCEECGCNKIPSIEIVNDEQLAIGIEQVRDEFLARQPSSSFTRLSATILIREEKSQTWKRGSVNGTLIAYPASTVKLMYMYSAIEWCKTQGYSIDCLDRYVRPMIIVSSNLDTGYVVDAITNTTNLADLISINDTRWSNWLYQRLSIERLLIDLNLYENQVVRSKTYPTNSGQSPIGSESLLLRSPSSRNMLQSCCTASFMLYLMQTRPKNEFEYMKSMLYHTLESEHTTFGNGLPAGSILYSKVGNAYDTVEEIAYIILPNGKEIILSAFSNGFQRPPSDFYILGRFTEMILEKFSLNSSTTEIFTTDNEDIYTCKNDVVKYTSSLPKDTIGQSLITFNTSCIIHPILMKRGVYTVSIWNPSSFDSTPTMLFRMNVAVTDVYNETDGDSGYVYNQQTSVSRWISVGDFLLNSGQQTVYLKALNQKAVFNAIRFSLHPPITIDANIQSKSFILISCNTFFYLTFLFLLFQNTTRRC